MSEQAIVKRLDNIDRRLAALAVASVVYLSIDETAEFLKRPKSSVYHLVSAREIPFRKVGKRLLFSKAELISWVESQKVRSNDEVEMIAANLGGAR